MTPNACQGQTALDFTAARVRADAGIAQAAEATERREPGWTELAAEALREFFRDRREPMTVEAARVQLAGVLSTPHDLRTWGAATQRAVRLGYIEWSGDYAPAASSNLSPKKKYQRGANA